MGDTFVCIVYIVVVVLCTVVVLMETCFDTRTHEFEQDHATFMLGKLDHCRPQYYEWCVDTMIQMSIRSTRCGARPRHQDLVPLLFGFGITVSAGLACSSELTPL